jgi:hypothetical protein
MIPLKRKRPNKQMRTNPKSCIRFALGAGCVLAATIGAFHQLSWFYFSVLFAGGCGLMGQRSIWEKVAAIARGNKSNNEKLHF